MFPVLTEELFRTLSFCEIHNKRPMYMGIKVNKKKADSVNLKGMNTVLANKGVAQDVCLYDTNTNSICNLTIVKNKSGNYSSAKKLGVYFITETDLFFSYAALLFLKDSEIKVQNHSFLFNNEILQVIEDFDYDKMEVFVKAKMFWLHTILETKFTPYVPAGNCIKCSVGDYCRNRSKYNKIYIDDLNTEYVQH